MATSASPQAGLSPAIFFSAKPRPQFQHLYLGFVTMVIFALFELHNSCGGILLSLLGLYLSWLEMVLFGVTYTIVMELQIRH